MSDQSMDLVARLADAARDAVLARRAAIEARSPGALRSVVVELEPFNRGTEVTVETYLNWRHTRRGLKAG